MVRFLPFLIKILLCLVLKTHKKNPEIIANTGFLINKPNQIYM
ncbi:hypothetical protein KU06112801_1070002 [Flavobacterium psychrophilum]|nr:hypothetical protein KU06112801_1070002 [Flavobacterium psychrophilum]